MNRLPEPRLAARDAARPSRPALAALLLAAAGGAAAASATLALSLQPGLRAVATACVATKGAMGSTAPAAAPAAPDAAAATTLAAPAAPITSDPDAQESIDAEAWRHQGVG